MVLPCSSHCEHQQPGHPLAGRRETLAVPFPLTPFQQCCPSGTGWKISSTRIHPRKINLNSQTSKCTALRWVCKGWAQLSFSRGVREEFPWCFDGVGINQISGLENTPKTNPTSEQTSRLLNPITKGHICSLAEQFQGW